MAAPTSMPMVLAALVPLPFVIVVCILRFWIRYKRDAWGPDDWAMLISLVSHLEVQYTIKTDETPQPFWIVSMIATIALAWSGVGAKTQTADQITNSYRWFYIFQEPWCFALITIKCSIGFALIRIANGKKWMERTVYVCMGACFFVMGGTGMYLFFRCHPVQ